MSNSSPENLLTVEEAIKILEFSGFSTPGYRRAAQTLIAAFKTSIDLSTQLSADHNEALRALSIANSKLRELETSPPVTTASTKQLCNELRSREDAYGMLYLTPPKEWTEDQKQEIVEELLKAQQLGNLPCKIIPDGESGLEGFSSDDLKHELMSRNHTITGEHPLPQKAENHRLNNLIRLVHYEQCPSCYGEIDTGYQCKKCEKEYGEWFKLFSAMDVLRDPPALLLQALPLSAEEKQKLSEEWRELYNRDERIVPVLGELTLDQYQQNALITEAPVDEDRWDKALAPMLQNLIRTGAFLSQTNLDATKKFAAYGKIPDDLQIANLSDISSFPPCTGKVIALRPIYRLLHGLVGIFTEVEELSSLISAAVDHAWDTTDEDADSILLTLEDFDIPNLKEELGDMFWYMALIADAAGFKLQECLELNEQKLQKLRYKTGKFTTDEAINRTPQKERAIFEEPPAQNLCPDCSTPLVIHRKAGYSYCPDCEPEEDSPTVSIETASFRSGLNKHVIGFTADFTSPDFSAHAGQWAFEDENTKYHGPFTTEYDAIAALKQYAAKNFAASHSFVDTSHDVCGYCGKTGHNINDCKERAGLAATPEKLEQEIVAVEVKAQTGIKPGDTVRSIRKSLRNYKFIVNRLGKGRIALVTVDYVPTIGVTGEPYVLGEELSLSVDELVKVN